MGAVPIAWRFERNLKSILFVEADGARQYPAAVIGPLLEEEAVGEHRD
jgi:hypothetical protein